MPWNLTGNAGTTNADFLGTTDSEPLAVRTNNQEAMRVDASGNIGFGTQTPAAKVEIVGNWSGREGALRLTGDKPTLKFVAGPIAGNRSWIIQVGSDGPGSLEFFRQTSIPGRWENLMTLTSAGSLGVGTASPNGRAEIVGDWDGTEGALRLTGDKPTIKFVGGTVTEGASWLIHVGGDGPGSLEFFKQGKGPNQWDNVMTLSRPTGNVGIGTSNPQSKLQINAQDAVLVVGYQPFITMLDTGTQALSRVQGIGGDLAFHTNSTIQGNQFAAATIKDVSGNVGIGTPNPNHKLEVAGDSFVWGAHSVIGPSTLSGGVSVHGDISTNGMINAGDIFLAGSDCAEDFPYDESKKLEPGTVVVAGEDNDRVASCSVPYDRRVVGVVSGAGEYKPGVVLGRRVASNERVPVALVGRVCCLVDARYGEVCVGDPLTTSSTAGHAMKALDRSRAFGAVLGKALAPMAAGSVGLLPVLVALQ